MSDMVLKTVSIDDPKAPGGFVDINESDFDDKTMKLYVPQKEDKKDDEKESKAKK